LVGGPDPDPSNNTVEESTLVEPTVAPDLAITKVDFPDPVRVGERLKYTITVRNKGPVEARSVMVFDNLPRAVTFVSAVPSTGNCNLFMGNFVFCQTASLTNGAGATIEIVVVPTAEGTITNKAQVWNSIGGGPPDPTPADNVVEERTTVSNPFTVRSKWWNRVRRYIWGR
jgi:uncharacterized repeat protein (TIGR01451 family)